MTASIHLIAIGGLLEGWVADFFTYLVTGVLGFIGDIISTGIRTFILFDSPYADPRMQEAFQHNLDIFPQLLVIMVMAGVASKPFADQREVTNFMLAWKALKVIIFVAVARQVMHYSLLLTNAAIRHIFTADYGSSFGPEVLKAGLESAAGSSAGIVIGALVLSMVSVAGILLSLGVFVLREFLFNATFILLPVIGAMLYLDFGPLSYAAELAKMVLQVTGYLLVAGVVMAGLLQTGAAAAGAYADATGQAATAASNSGFGDVLEAYFFWLIGLVAPALVGIKAVTMAGLSPRRVSGRQGAKSSSGSQQSVASQSDGGSTRTALMEQARHGASRGLRRVDKSTNGVGSSAASTAGNAMNRVKSTASGAVANHVSEGKREWSKSKGKTIEKGSKRTAKDLHAGADYATRNLHQSPVDWAEAGLERYREKPVVDTSSESGTTQQKLDNWTSETSSSSQSE
ncbi:hypothetical protein BV210_18480 (plasmid) [Halorientalis sp. IM1011]|uniref:hypothetical protein n=1 Tax=Halorientalis sp. IM1011 TaxID=1932360 RepID=UPI00097CD47F|nr:hypothetical protein [Halorientalis sp. IM1011]AQL44737.1 hypothetical protein BV210_18480 [Halorientalis sp. IM1011]